ALARRTVEVHENESLPDFQMHWAEAMLLALQAVEALLVRHPDQAAVEIVRPAMKLAEELLGGAALGVGHLVHAVRTYVVERVNRPFSITHDQNRGIAGIQLPDEVIACA